MDRRLLLVGVVVFVFGSAISWVGTSQSIDQISGASAGYQEAALAAGSDAYVPFSSNGSTTLVSAYETVPNASIDFYIMNSSAFASVSGTVNSDGRLEQQARSLVGGGLVAMILGSSAGQYPYTSVYGSFIPVPDYSANYSRLPEGTYYLVFENPTQTNTTVFYSIVMSNAFSSIQGQLTGSSSATGVVGVLVAVAGLAVCVYSLFRKSARKESAGPAQEEVDRLYAGVERRGIKEKRKARKGTAKRKRRRGQGR
ncbi:MAG: hypothetical protein KGH69_01680 [Candidatus Micrarchaeota archaeon]|nr:hypothetical protein [Candidatus Micrarchaeota archaeon]